MAAWRIRKISVYDTTGGTVALNIIGGTGTSQPSKEWTSTGTTAEPSMIVVDIQKLFGASATIGQWNSYTAGNVLLFQVTAGSSGNTFVDVDLEFSPSNENVAAASTAAASSAGSTYVLALDNTATGGGGKWPPVSAYLTLP
jgi:hypothetical protein